MTRLDRIRRRIREQEADALLLSFMPDVRWAVGFTGSNGLLVVKPEATHFVTDGRYQTQAHEEVVDGVAIHVPGYDLIGHVAAMGLLADAQRVLVQAEHTTLAGLTQLEAALPAKAFVAVQELLVDLVASKDEEEIDRIRAAQAVTDQVFDAVLPYVQPGISEQDLAAEIVYQHLKRGCERMAFEPIVACGLRSALPHAHPTTRTIRPGDAVLIDMGGVLDGYASDMTRTVFVGSASDTMRTVYGIVLDAQSAALDAMRAGQSGTLVDNAARDVIAAAGYGPQFSHSLGHGIGLQTHEWPRLSARAEDILPAGATVTVEPGIYLPERFGIRIEDLVVVRDDGYENLTTTPKALLVV